MKKTSYAWAAALVLCLVILGVMIVRSAGTGRELSDAQQLVESLTQEKKELSEELTRLKEEKQTWETERSRVVKGLGSVRSVLVKTLVDLEEVGAVIGLEAPPSPTPEPTASPTPSPTPELKGSPTIEPKATKAPEASKTPEATKAAEVTKTPAPTATATAAPTEETKPSEPVKAATEAPAAKATEAAPTDGKTSPTSTVAPSPGN